MGYSRVRLRVEGERAAVEGAARSLGWDRWSQEGRGDWNVWWASPALARQALQPEHGVRLTDSQIVSHFPNHQELTRKDLMAKNVRRYTKDLEKRESGGGGRGSYGPAWEGGDGAGSGALDCVPTTYNLPQDFPLFCEEHRRRPSPWIVKPSSRAQGKGIFLITRISQVRKWASAQWAPGASPSGGGGGGGGGLGPSVAGMAGGGGQSFRPPPPHTLGPGDGYVVSRYIDNPLLIGGRKFDLRLYVLVLSFRPLQAYVSRLGFARFCGNKYTADTGSIDDALVHLTNVAVQKHADDYNRSHGNKWPLSTLQTYLESNFGTACSRRLFRDMDAVILHSLKAVQGAIVSDRHCFELYGYDIIVDGDLKPWLIEVNASPSLSSTTPADLKLKTAVLSDTFAALVPGDRVDLSRPRPLPPRVGSLELLIDESRPPN